MMGWSLYVLVGITTLASLHWASSKSKFQSRAKRSILSGSVGATSYGLFDSWTPTISILEVSLEGQLSIYGYVFVSGFFAMLAVWGWNLFTTRRYLVR